MKKKTLFLVLFSLLLFKVKAQNNSFKKEFNTLDSKGKIAFYKSVSDSLKILNKDFLVKALHKLSTLKQATPQNRKKALLFLVDMNRLSGHYTKNIALLHKILSNPTLKLTGKDSISIYKNLNHSYYKLRLYEEIFENNLKIERLLEKGVKYNLWEIMVNSEFYAKLLQYGKAAKALKKEIKYVQSKKQRDSLILPSMYNSLGYYYYLNNSLDSAMVYYKKSLKTAEISLKKTDTLNYKRILGLVKGNISSVYIKQEKYKKAIPLLQEDITIAKITNTSKVNLYGSYNALAKCYLKTNQLHKAIKIFKLIKPYYLNNISREGNKDYLINKAQYFIKRKQVDSVDYYFKKVIRINDSITKINKNKFIQGKKQVFSLEEKLRKEKQRKFEINQIKLQQKIKQKKGLVLFVSIISVLLLISLYMLKKIINSKKQIESQNDQIKKALSDKEVLLKEVHHRVKNNLQMISGLFALQNMKVENEAVKKMLNEGQNRIQSVALVHKLMYQSNDISFVNMQHYLHELLQHLKRSYNSADKHIKSNLEVEPIDLNLRIAVPISLIVNEVVTNIYKHAFKGRKEGAFTVNFKTTRQGIYELTIQDDGVGLPNNLDINKLDSIGFDLINGLTKQIKGKLKIENKKGTVIHIIFNYKNE